MSIPWKDFGLCCAPGYDPISQEKMLIYLSFFQFTHNLKVRGKRLLHSLTGVAGNVSPRTPT